jgi:superfamily II DNA or RNA helicase/HKD family nuclease
MAPGLIRDKVADRFATLNPSIRITQLSGQDLRDQIGRTILREAHGLYTQWQQQDSERVLRKSADTLEVILAGLKLQGLTEADLLQAREDRLNMFGAFDQGSFLQGAGREPGPWMVDDIPAFFMAPDHADRLIYLIRSELERSDRAWIASAFYSPGVTNLLISGFIRFMETGGQLFVLTSTMGNVNRPENLTHLRDTVPGIRVKVYPPPHIPFDQAPPGFHPKAYLFQHRDGRGALLIGSSNFTEAGFLKNVEWNYFSSDEVNLPFDGHSPFDVVLAEFMRHWDQESVALTDDFLSAYRTRWQPPDMGRRDIFEPPAAEWSPPPVRPNPAQVEALENLRRMRDHGVKKASVIAATGVGKTHLAAFDYKASGAPRLLFIAHRENILVKAREIFRSVLGRQDFGEILGAGRPGSSAPEAVFAMIQTLAKEDTLNRLGPDHFDYLIVDEFHHGMAPTYLRAIDYFQSRFMLGLTATPERMDGRDVLRLCEYNVAYEVRLLDAVDKGWLSPFQYFAIHDETDYKQITWRGTHYDEDELTRALSNDTRTAIIAANLKKYLPSFGKIKALAFCSSISHAAYTARRLTEDHKIEAVALTGATPAQDRISAIQRLEDEADPLNVICTVDIFNEGVDIPGLTHVLLLRPTQSFTVFLQQLGRGLRIAPNKDFLVVIDFVGNFRKAHVAPLALSGYTSIQEFAADATVAFKRAEPAYTLPKGCFLDPDIQVRRIWDREIRAILKGKIPVEDRLKALYADIRADLDDTSPTLFDFLNNAYNVDPYVFIRHFGNWLRTRLACEGTLSEQEQALLDTPAEAFLTHLESGLRQVKSYKEVVLTSLLDMPGATWNIDAIAAAFYRFFMDHPDKRFDYTELAASPDPKAFSLSRVKAKLLEMPLHYLSNKKTDWFILDRPGNTFSLKPELAPYWNDPFFRALVADRVRFALTRYFARKAQVAEIPYTPDMHNTGFPVPRDFALAFYPENPLKQGESRKIKLKVNGKRYDVLFQRPGPAREYLILYDAEDEVAHAWTAYLADEFKPATTAFIIRTAGRNELNVEAPGTEQIGDGYEQ